MSSLFTLILYKTLGFERRSVVLQEGETKESLAKLARKGDMLVPLDFVDIAQKTTTAVVHITAKYGNTNASNNKRNNRQNNINDLFRDFFGDNDMFGQMPRNGQRGEATGSGVIITEDGYIVTNNHVVADASEIEVSLNDKRTYKAEVIGTSPATDLAVIKIKEKGLGSLSFGNSDILKVGEWVVAVGNPFNLQSTVTAGIVSAKGRNLNLLKNDRNGRGDNGTKLAPVESFIQTDAVVNPGNSGGALVNTKGELIGINTAIASPTGSFAGYSFAVPSNLVKKIVKDLIEFGSVQRGYLGASIRDLDGKLAEEKGIKDLTQGAYIEAVQDESAASEGGLKEGDIVIGVDGKKIKSSAELLEEIAKRRPNDKLTLLIKRSSGEKTINVYLKNEEGKKGLLGKKSNTDMQKSLGADFANLSSKEKSSLNISGGAKVENITGGKIGQQTDIREGFIITKLNGQPIKDADDLLNKLKTTRGGVLLSGIYPDDDSNTEYYYGFGM
ncbi:MAG: Do family serine endopeptidase [Bacteroidetes bacterium]|nr:MAG: Do family serine endopeptidase [Bacteroidota bacterium]TAG85294.1 MAG: Do family serine endopeptidase [Bacteroidota bacterium]